MLKKAVIEFEPLDAENAEKLTLDLYGSDGSEDLKRTFTISCEVRVPLLSTLMPLLPYLH